MVFSSIEVALRTVQSSFSALDVDALSGASASSLVDTLAPFKRQFDAFFASVSSHAVAANQHNADGARSGAAWLASKTGVSERQARAELAAQKSISDQPDVAEAVSRGDISLETGAAIGRAADGDSSVARELLSTARTSSFEVVAKRAAELRVTSTSAERRERLRRSQFVSIKDRDGVVSGQFQLLPELAAPFCEASRKAVGSTSWERAESFARNLSSANSSRPSVVFHMDVVTKRCELKGVGPVPAEAVIPYLEDASLKFVGTVDNKLAWFSEQHRRSMNKELPEYVKRAVRAKSWDTCEVQGCVDVATEVDHTIARINGGTNDLVNLRALCGPDHVAKTKRDAPWTAGGIYEKPRTASAPTVNLKRESPPQGELFRDTG